jgi:putative pyridoxal-dependent aspartate 1-decarboxylase
MFEEDDIIDFCLNEEPQAEYFTEKDNIRFNAEIQRLVKSFLNKTSVTSSVELEQLRQEFNFSSIPEEGLSESSFLKELEELVIPHSMNTGSPYFIGHMTSLLPNFIRPMAQLLTALNQNNVKVETAKSTTFYEKQALAMVHQEVFGNSDSYYEQSLKSEDSLGIVTSGGTLANLTALQCARNHSLSKFANVEEEGVLQALQAGGFKRSVVLASRLGHYSINKALGILGMGKRNLITIESDEYQRLDVPSLRREVIRCKEENIHISAIVGIAGTTECGSFDPLDEMANLCEDFDIHFHVDAAWGGVVLFSETHKHLLKGIEKADSVTVDGHKQFYLPMGLGMVLFKTPSIPGVITSSADYIIRKGSFDQGRVSIEGSRPANVIYLQAAMKLFGREGYQELINKSIATAKRMAEAIDKAADFELLTSPQSNIFLYRFIPLEYREKTLDSAAEELISSLNIKLQEAQKLKGQTFVSRTRFTPSGGNEAVTALRVVIANPLTTIEHCHRVLEDQRQIMVKLLTAIFFK